MLEIVINGGKCCRRFGLKRGDAVIVRQGLNVGAPLGECESGIAAYRRS